MKKRKFNIIDAIIILLVAACAVGIALRYRTSDSISKSAENVNVEISIYVEKVSRSTTSAFVYGDEFYWGNVRLGTLKSVDVSKATEYVMDEEGNCVKAEREDKCDVRLTLSSTGTYTDSGFMLSGTTYLAPGKLFEINSINVSTSGLVMEIVEVGQ